MCASTFVGDHRGGVAGWSVFVRHRDHRGVAASAVRVQRSHRPRRPGLAQGCAVGPGLVDLHTHLREPGREEAETIETAARAAALGGYTAVVAMPNTEPPCDCRLGRRRRARARGGCRAARSPWRGRSHKDGRASRSRRWPRWPARRDALHRRRRGRRRRRPHAPRPRVRARPRRHVRAALRGRGDRSGRRDARGRVVVVARPRGASPSSPRPRWSRATSASSSSPGRACTCCTSRRPASVRLVADASAAACR